MSIFFLASYTSLSHAFCSTFGKSTTKGILIPPQDKDMHDSVTSKNASHNLDI